VTVVIGVRLERNFLCPRFLDIAALVVRVTVTSTSGSNLVLLGCFLCSTSCTVFIDTGDTLSIRCKMFNKVHLDTNNWSPVTKCVVS